MMTTINTSSYEVTFCIDSKMGQRKYDELTDAAGAEKLDDEQACDFVSKRFGFDVKRIEIERHASLNVYTGANTTRKTGAWINRDPYHVASDWNYIRFRVCGMLWEVVNGYLEMVAE